MFGGILEGEGEKLDVDVIKEIFNNFVVFLISLLVKFDDYVVMVMDI